MLLTEMVYILKKDSKYLHKINILFTVWQTKKASATELQRSDLLYKMCVSKTLLTSQCSSNNDEHRSQRTPYTAIFFSQLSVCKNVVWK